ncbi:hypothetical protein HN385_04530 [archaeon]|jgi:hypothetical protein|nr:hypothetical protein [archaeon]MBT3450857.1 hypothetical protein [archaeon]MBT6868734.1 hypothetical protein [archaeon]MBT7192359.1 hypothetical protein [archaeon]MBT7381188.1 hypothetical protein [archaeon]
MSLDDSMKYMVEVSDAIKSYQNHSLAVSSNFKDEKLTLSEKKSSLEIKVNSKSKLNYTDESSQDNDDFDELGDTIDFDEFFRMEQEFAEQSMLYSQQHESIYVPQHNEEIYEFGKEEEQYVANSKSETMDDPEAQEAVEQIVTEAVLGVQNLEKLSLEDRRRFSNWQNFNKALLMLYHNTSSMVTSEVDYK